VSRPEPAGSRAPTGPSEERFATVSTRQGDLDLCYQTFGDPDDDAMLLVMGLGGPMTWWDEGFCARLAGRGFHVIRYDNRDAGRSSRVDAGSPVAGSSGRSCDGPPLRRTPWSTWPTTASGCSTISVTTAPTSSASRWEA